MTLSGLSRRDFLRSAAATGALALAGRSGRAASKSLKKGRKPNIVLVVLDELGYFELSCMGNKHLKTPRIDRMAAEGMRFTQALGGGPVCAPTRSVLMTGLHTGHTTVRANGGGLALRAEDVTVAQALKKAGYATGGFGKWGLGDRGTTGVPERHGFDYFFGYYHQVHAHCFFPNYLVRNGEKVPLEGNTGDLYEGKQFSQYLIFDEAKRFIRKNKDAPFFCYCPWTPPHGLWGFPKDDPIWSEYADKPWTAGQRTHNDAKVYAAMVAMIDRQIGDILDLLRELGLDDDTLVIVSGDNGGQAYFKRDPRKPKSPVAYPNGFFSPNGGVFRGGKGALYEGGLRVPMIARWPGMVAPGSVSDHLLYFADIMPTLAELAGAPPPEPTDGISIAPTLLDERPQPLHKYLYWEFNRWRAVRMGSWKAVFPPKKPAELYDLKSDLGEERNVAGQHPDILAKMVAYAEEAHEENIPGAWLPGGREKGFKDHGAK